jgi:hypothetical protein
MWPTRVSAVADLARSVTPDKPLVVVAPYPQRRELVFADETWSQLRPYLVRVLDGISAEVDRRRWCRAATGCLARVGIEFEGESGVVLGETPRAGFTADHPLQLGKL